MLWKQSEPSAGQLQVDVNREQREKVSFDTNQSDFESQLRLCVPVATQRRSPFKQLCLFVTPVLLSVLSWAIWERKGDHLL